MATILVVSPPPTSLPPRLQTVAVPSVFVPAIVKSRFRSECATNGRTSARLSVYRSGGLARLCACIHWPAMSTACTWSLARSDWFPYRTVSVRHRGEPRSGRQMRQLQQRGLYEPAGPRNLHYMQMRSINWG
ncbi:hypothetical protein AAHC03_012872 [Spirometra sp. Aus1]